MTRPDPHGRVAQARRAHALRRLALLALTLVSLIALARPAAAQVPPGAEDPRIVMWSRDYLAGRGQEVLAAVERDLKSPAPHPWAVGVWIDTQRALSGQDVALAVAKADPVVQGAVRIAAQANDDQKRGRHEAVLAAAAAAGPSANEWLLRDAMTSAMALARYRDLAQLAERLEARRPDGFYAAWDDAWLATLPTETGLPELVRSRSRGAGPFAGSPAGRFVARLALPSPPGAHVRLAAVDELLRARPADPHAHRYRGYVLRELERYEESARAFEVAARMFPFGAGASEAACDLVRSGKPAEARQLVVAFAAARRLTGEALGPHVDSRYAQALREAGELGRAREVLEVALKKAPSHDELNDALAELEVASGRYAVAVPYARTAAQAKPEDAARLKRWIDATRLAGKPQEAFDLFTRSAVRTPDLYSAASAALAALERHAERVPLLEQALARFPALGWMTRELATALHAAGRTKDALLRLEASFAQERFNDWALDRLLEWTKATAGAKAADAALLALKPRFAGETGYWERLAARVEEPNGVARKLAIWDEAIGRNPARSGPLEQKAMVLHAAERFDEAEAVVRLSMKLAPTMSLDEAIGTELDLAWTMKARALKTKYDPAKVEEALKHLDAFRQRGGETRTYQSYRAALYLAVGRKEEAAEAAYAHWLSAPDSGDALWRLHSDVDVGERRWTALARHVERNPYDGDRLWRAQKLHALYGGSAIVALRVAQQMRQRTPDKSPPDEGEAYKRLGDAARDYELGYARATSIAASDRYVGWYDDTRAGALRSSTAVGFPFDPKSQTQCPTAFARRLVSPGSETWAVICHPSGEAVVREDHPLTGKLQLLQRGSAYVRYSYDALGAKLLRIETSGRDWVALDYDARDNIAKLRESNGKETSFEYNEKKKPVVIKVKGEGQISVQYAPNGEIAKVDSPAGRGTALQVTASFQRLMELIAVASQADKGRIPDIPHRDEALDRLRREVSAAPAGARGRSRMRLALHLAEHAEDAIGHAAEAEHLLEALVLEGRGAKAAPDRADAVAAAAAWYRLKRTTRPAGFGTHDLATWNTLRDWLASTLGTPEGKQASAVLKDASERPIALMQSARWLPRSELDTPGPWRVHPRSKVLPQPLQSGELKAVLVRANNDVVVGTSAGLAVLRRGFWEWYGLDEARGQFSGGLAYDKVRGTSDVLALAEDDRRRLWVGTAAGLFALEGAYDGPARSWRTTQDGLPTSRVEQLADIEGGVFVGTAAGGRIFDLDAKVITPGRLGGEPIVLLSSARAADKDAPLLAITPAGLYAYARGKTTELARGPVASATWFPEESRVVFLRDKALFGVRLGGDLASEPVRLPGQQDIVLQHAALGLALLPITREGKRAVALMTDLGASLYRDNHVEHLYLRQGDKRVGVKAMASRGGRAFLLTSEGVTALELEQTTIHSGRVHDLLTLPEVGATFVARGDSLTAVRHKDTKEELVDAISATHLARHPKGGFVVNDGSRILRYNPSVGAPQELFDASPTTPSPSSMFSAGPLRSILVASDETVWVVSGSYLYRFKDGKKEELSTVLDPVKFPARSEMLSRVLETVDHKIWVIASDEGFRMHQGMSLSGGVVQWNGAGFDRLDLQSDGWFMRSYTAVDADTAIVGTNVGMARHQRGGFASFDRLKEPSYRRVKDRMPQLWLGTRGARIGSIWLFGSAGGVVAYKEGTWFVPDRLNWMLPAQGLAAYGSRHVHAVESDEHGRVYVGTDAGLLVYDSGGGDAAAFLLTNQLEAEAFSDAAAQQLQRESDVLLAGSKNTAITERIQRVNALKKEISELKAQDSPAERPTVMGGAATQEKAPPRLDEDQKRGLDAKLREKEKSLADLLLRIEREDPGLSQMLELKPIDLAAVRSRLADDQVIVQYLPTETTLYVQVVTRTSREVREVHVTRKELLERARRAANRLAGRRGESLRGLVLQQVLEANQGPLDAELAWLYQQLLRPVEGDLAQKRFVYVVPVGELTYLPFGALLRSTSPQREYAVERFTFGYLTSLYMFDLMQRNVPSGTRGAYIVGDPDGSLPGARSEAKAIAGYHPQSVLRIGAQATYENLLADGPKSQVMHFATHGILDHNRPERSALLLANKVRLTVPDAMTLQLKNTDLVVLSACETGIGRSGLEYATLARAFMHSGVSTVLATLWSVDDAASARLMKELYERMNRGEDRLTALTGAQRALLASEQKELHDPAKWASYVGFGKP